jgi:hypothetical protein
MRAAMAAAEVGDDQFGEDPTTNAGAQFTRATMPGVQLDLGTVQPTSSCSASRRLGRTPQRLSIAPARRVC